MELAFAYLKCLNKSGYFAKKHKFCDGVSVMVNGTELSAPDFESVRAYLTSQGFLEVKERPWKEMKDEGVHPKDMIDGWWFELTKKGESFLANNNK
jgi:hypothetical protein